MPANSEQTVGELVYKISGDTQALRADLQKAEKAIQDLSAKADGGAVAMQNASKQAEGFGKTLSGLGTAVKGFIAIELIGRAVQAISGFVRGSVKAASDLNESINAVNTVFGEGAGIVREFGEQAAQSAGLSERAFNQAVTPIGAMLRNMGYDARGAAEEAVNLTQRAADMASVFNTDVDTALQAIQAGLRGEIDPLEKYGVKLSAVTIEQRAMAETGKTNAKALTEQEKAAARVGLIYEQTEKLAGDFARTSQDLANKQRILTAEQENNAASLGQSLMPTVIALQDEYESLTLAVNGNTSGLEAFGQVVYTVTNVLVLLGKGVIGAGKLFQTLTIVIAEGANVILGAFKDIGENVVSMVDGYGEAAEALGKGKFKKAGQLLKNAFKFDFGDTKKAINAFNKNVKAEFEKDIDFGESIKSSFDKAFSATSYQDALTAALIKQKEAAEELKNKTEELIPPTQQLAEEGKKLEDAEKKVAEEAEKAAEKVEDFQGKIVDLIASSQDASKEIEGNLATSFETFGKSLNENITETVSNMAQIVIKAQDNLKELKKQLKETDDPTERKDLRKQIKAQERVLDAREDYEERQADRISAIRSKLEEAGVDVAKSGLDEVLNTRSLEEQIEDERRLAGLDEFTRFEEEQARKLVLLTDAFIGEVSILQEKLKTQKEYEAELTTYLASEDSKRLENTDKWAQATISKYREVANSLQNLLSPQAQITNAQAGAITPVSPSSVARTGVDATRPGSSSTDNSRTNNINAPVTINGTAVQNLSPKELSAILGFELNKFIR